MAAYRLVQLRNGQWAVHSAADGETMHPGGGPVTEATALYVDQLGIVERVRATGRFVIWDIGLGAAANALAAISACQALGAHLQIVSFDATDEPLRFARDNDERLAYIRPWRETIDALIAKGKAEFLCKNLRVAWNLHLGDFPRMLGRVGAVPRPDAIFFDPFSPRANPAMWTRQTFTALYGVLDRARACSLATYSRSTMVRAAMLLAGFFAGRGRATGLKEETTIAATSLDLITEPLDATWLRRAERSRSAEPLSGPEYLQAPLRPQTLELLRRHPQFHHP